MISNSRNGLPVLAYLSLAILLFQDIWGTGQGMDLDIWGKLALSAMVLVITCPFFAFAVLSVYLTLKILMQRDRPESPYHPNTLLFSTLSDFTKQNSQFPILKAIIPVTSLCSAVVLVVVHFM